MAVLACRFRHIELKTVFFQPKKIDYPTEVS